MAKSRILIKVGSRTTLRFRNTKVYRAITIAELCSLSEMYDDANIVIIEHIDESEYSELITFLSRYIKLENKQVLFYVPDNDEMTTGAADELDSDIYLTAPDLYRAINEKCGIIVDPDISLNKSKAVYSSDDPFNNDFNDAFTDDDAGDQFSEVIEAGAPNGERLLSEDLVGKVYKTKVDIGIPDGGLGDSVTGESEAVPGKIGPGKIDDHVTGESNVNLDGDTDEIGNMGSGVPSDRGDTGDTGEVGRPDITDKRLISDDNDSPIRVETTNNVPIIPIVPVIPVSKPSPSLSAVIPVAIPAIPPANSDVIRKYTKEIAESARKLDDTKEELAESKRTAQLLKSQILEAVAKINNLNKVVLAIKDERDAIKADLVAIETAPMIVDPVTLADYEALKSRVAEVTERLESTSSKTSSEVAKLETERDEAVDLLKHTKVELRDTEDKLGALEIQNQGLQRQLSEALDTSKQDQIIGELNIQIEELTASITDAEGSIEEFKTRQSADTNTIDKLSQQLDDNSVIRLNLLDMLNRAVEHLQEVSLLRSRVVELQNDNDDLLNTIGRLTADVTDKELQLEKTITDAEKRIELARSFLTGELEKAKSSATIELEETKTSAALELEAVKSDADKRVELARSFVAEELQKAKTDAITFKSQLDFVSVQLSAKETQLNSLIQTTGLDENGVSSIVETNKTLDAMNTTLRLQLSDLKTAYDGSERERLNIRQDIETLKDQNSKLNTQIRALSTGYTGGAGVGMIPAVTYQGRGQIIVVVGSGSYGVTTSAYTAALTLANTSKVLFIDFDMISAKADSWFKISPMIRGIPGYGSGNSKSSGLGIMIDKGVPFFLTYATSIILKPIKTKGGYLDYLSGLYEKPDVVKLVATDFSSFLNYLGNTYDYLVFDFGRLGASDINNQVVKLISNVALSTVVVTSSDRIDIRNTRIEIQKSGLGIENIAWLVNLGETTKLDEKSRNNISPASCVQLPFINDFYGRKLDFGKDRVSKDKFNMFLEKSILHR